MQSVDRANAFLCGEASTLQSCCFVNIWAIGPLSNPNEFGYFFLKLASENKYILSMFLFGFYLDRRSIVVSLRLPFHLIIYIILCDPPLFKKKNPTASGSKANATRTLVWSVSGLCSGAWRFSTISVTKSAV